MPVSTQPPLLRDTWDRETRDILMRVLQEITNRLDALERPIHGGFQMTNHTDLRSIDAEEATIDDLADFATTLAERIRDRNIVGP